MLLTDEIIVYKNEWLIKVNGWTNKKIYIQNSSFGLECSKELPGYVNTHTLKKFIVLNYYRLLLRIHWDKNIYS